MRNRNGKSDFVWVRLMDVTALTRHIRFTVQDARQFSVTCGSGFSLTNSDRHKGHARVIIQHESLFDS